MAPNPRRAATSPRGAPVDPRRSAILLIGGDKTGDGRFHEWMIPIADKLYDINIDEIRREGLIP